jgi:hypothetical protein
MKASLVAGNHKESRGACIQHRVLETQYETRGAKADPDLWLREPKRVWTKDNRKYVVGFERLSDDQAALRYEATCDCSRDTTAKR